MGSLIKIPFIISSTFGIHTVMSPPNRSPPSHEQLEPTGLDHVIALIPVVTKSLHFGAQAVFWCCAVLEVAVILSSIRPSSLFSQRILHLFVVGSTPLLSTSKIRITPLYLIGWLFSISGALIRLSCYRILGTLFTFELSIRKDHKLITSGPYSVVRHPSYSGAILGAVGIVMCQLSEGSWARECTILANNAKALTWIWLAGGVVIVLGITTRTRKEDNMLRERFGGEWEAWRKAVPWRIFPGVY